MSSNVRSLLSLSLSLPLSLSPSLPLSLSPSLLRPLSSLLQSPVLVVVKAKLAVSLQKRGTTGIMLPKLLHMSALNNCNRLVETQLSLPQQYLQNSLSTSYTHTSAQLREFTNRACIRNPHVKKHTRA